MKSIWKFRITNRHDEPDSAQGYVRADTEADARSAINQTNVILHQAPSEKVWPGGLDDNLFVTCGTVMTLPRRPT